MFEDQMDKKRRKVVCYLHKCSVIETDEGTERGSQNCHTAVRMVSHVIIKLELEG